MGEGVAWFACALGTSQHGRNRNERSLCEHSHCVPVRASRARKPSEPGVFAYFWRPKSMKRKRYVGHLRLEALKMFLFHI
jgi:hypothetical protein